MAGQHPRARLEAHPSPRRAAGRRTERLLCPPISKASASLRTHPPADPANRMYGERLIRGVGCTRRL